MRSKGTPGRNRRRHLEVREYLQICPSYKSRRLTPREVESFRKGMQAIIDRGAKA